MKQVTGQRDLGPANGSQLFQSFEAFRHLVKVSYLRLGEWIDVCGYP